MATRSNEQLFNGDVTVTGSMFITGSVRIDRLGTSPADAYLYVSGTKGITGTNARLAVFGGDVVISGSTTIINSTSPVADNPSGSVLFASASMPGLRLVGSNLVVSGTAGTATAGAGALPATPEGFIRIFIDGAPKKIPYYND